jgi:hypothetical protein
MTALRTPAARTDQEMRVTNTAEIVVGTIVIGVTLAVVAKLVLFVLFIL